MNATSRQSAAFSKVSVNSQTVIPRAVCEQLKLKPGDTLRFRLTDEEYYSTRRLKPATRSQRFPNGHPRPTKEPLPIYDGLRVKRGNDGRRRLPTPPAPRKRR